MDPFVKGTGQPLLLIPIIACMWSSSVCMHTSSIDSVLSDYFSGGINDEVSVTAKYSIANDMHQSNLLSMSCLLASQQMLALKLISPRTLSCPDLCSCMRLPLLRGVSNRSFCLSFTG